LLQLSHIRVLIVDDEQNILKFLEIGLQNGGFHVRTASDGLEAVVQAREFLPHIVVLDVMMPGMDGWPRPRQKKSTMSLMANLHLISNVQGRLCRPFFLGIF